MKKLIKISFLMAVLCFAAPVYADGDMSTGNKNCTSNCIVAGETTTIPTDSDDKKQAGSTINEIYSWIFKQISELID